MSKKAPTFREEMNCEKYINAELIVCMESPVNKSFAEGMQDTSIQKPVRYWFGMSPQSVPSIADKGISRLYTDRDVRKGALIPQRGIVQDRNGPEIQGWKPCKTFPDRKGRRSNRKQK